VLSYPFANKATKTIAGMPGTAPKAYDLQVMDFGK